MTRILVVDDDRLGLKTVKSYVARMGHEVLTAADGQEAFELWQAETPRIVITDWMMPVLDGLELVKKIRRSETDEYTYIIITTERKETRDLVSGFEAGADDYLTKPVGREELFVRLQAAERVLDLQSKDVVIFALAKLSEAKDTDTGFHLERIRNYCRILADQLRRNVPELELGQAFVDSIYLTSPLHDIGKVGIPDHILLKPSRLDDQEFAIMKRHTLIGHETLYSAYQQNPRAAYLKMSADIARHHHEKWDGSGYPDGLAGTDIPLAARVLAVADVYDALVSKRAYKDAFSHETARSIIFRGRGSHFDPQVVDAFSRSEEQIVEVLHAYLRQEGAPTP